MRRRDFLATLPLLVALPWTPARGAPATGLHVFGDPADPLEVRHVFAAGAAYQGTWPEGSRPRRPRFFAWSSQGPAS